MDINFLGLQEIEIKGYMALLTYLDGREVKYNFDNDKQREEFLQTVESYVQSIANIHLFNPN